jgi:hypothetical protein
VFAVGAHAPLVIRQCLLSHHPLADVGGHLVR